MFRHTFLAATLTLMLGLPAAADTIGPAANQLPKGFLYSPSALPFDAFEWTSLDLAAFAAYGGDFANVRGPAEQIFFFEEPSLPSGPTSPEDEQAALQLQAMSYFQGVPVENPQFASDELPEGGSDALSSIPEPGIALMVGIGLLGLSHRIRRSYRQG
jgi:hypothetical protein